MSTVTIDRQIDLEALPFPAQQTWDGSSARVDADVPEADLRAAVSAAPPAAPRVSVVERLAAVEARLDKAATASVTGEAAKLRDNLKPGT